MKTEATEDARSIGCLPKHVIDPSDRLDPRRGELPHANCDAPLRLVVVFAIKILAGGFALQLDIDARMPAKKLGGTIRIVFEEEVFHWIALMSGGALESWLNPSAHLRLMSRATLVPVVFHQRNHFSMG